MPKRNENVKRLLEFCDEHNIDLSDIQTAQEEARGHELDARLKIWAAAIAIAATLLTGAWRLFGTESIANQAHLENQAQERRLSLVEQTVNQQQVTLAVQTNQYQNMTTQLAKIDTQQQEILKLLTEKRK